MSRYSLTEVKKSFNASAASQPLIFSRLIRPFSFYMTYIVLRFRMNAYQANVVGLILGVLGCIFFILGGLTAQTGEPYLLIGTLLYLLFLVFDFVDGNVARVTDSVSYLGKFIDGVVDIFVETAIPLSLSIGYFLLSDSKPFLFAGIAITVLRLFSSYVCTRLSFINRWAEKELREKGIEFSKKSLNPFDAKGFPVTGCVNVMIDIKIIAIVVIGVAGFTAAALGVMLAAIGVQAIVLLVSPLVDATKTLNIRYISKWDPRARK